jgi:hypothetical protein
MKFDTYAGFPRSRRFAPVTIYSSQPATFPIRGLVFNPLIEEIRERGGVEPEKVIEALAEALKREYGSNPTRYPMQAILFEAEKP